MPYGFRLIERYIIGAILPYLLLAILLLTAVLFAQQSNRLTEMLLIARLPSYFLLEFSLALLPNIVAFTLPMATLVGVLVGFSRLGSDSELVAMRAAGVGTLRILLPVLLMGLVLSVLALFLNLFVTPQSARTLRRLALNAALYKLDSPVEPRSFNTEIQGRVLYVRDGDKTQGQWGRVFLFAQEKDGTTRLVTARSGRIDSAGEKSELVLSDAVATTLPKTKGDGKEGAYVTERLAQMRITFDIGRKALMDQLNSAEPDTEEMEVEELASIAYAGSDARNREAQTLLHKRLTLSMGPLVFALLGAGVGLRVRRGGRGLGLLLSLAALILHYLLTLLGEGWARAGALNTALCIWLANIVATICALALLLSTRRQFWGGLFKGRSSTAVGEGADAEIVVRQRERKVVEGSNISRWFSFPLLLDKGLLRSLGLSFAFTLLALTAIFLIFTLFELWRFIVVRGTPASVVAQYLLFLLPFASAQLTPASMLVSILATYALISRRSEVTAWLASGQSVYRLALPGIFFALAVGGCLWGLQEGILPQTNQRQNTLRAQIRGGRVSMASTETGGLWLASAETGRLYSYEYESEGALKDPAIYEFDGEGVHLRRVIKALEGRWAVSGPNSLELRQVEELEFSGREVVERRAERAGLERVETEDVFKVSTDKPSQLSAKALSAYIKNMKRRGVEVSALAVSLQRKYADPFGVLVMALVGIPLALSFGRRSAVTALAMAVVIGLGFWGATSGFEQMGRYGFLPPAVAAWAPLVVFGAAGTYLLTRART